jgi:hypothetical protein
MNEEMCLRFMEPGDMFDIPSNGRGTEDEIYLFMGKAEGQPGRYWIRRITSMNKPYLIPNTYVNEWVNHTTFRARRLAQYGPDKNLFEASKAGHTSVPST